MLVLARRDGRLGPLFRKASGTSHYLGTTGAITAKAVTATVLASLLGPAVRRPVINRTGLPGTYDVELRWTPSDLAAPARSESALGDTPDIFTAMQEQLGLKLEPSRAPVDILVIDRVERPTEN